MSTRKKVVKKRIKKTKAAVHATPQAEQQKSPDAGLSPMERLIALEKGIENMGRLTGIVVTLQEWANKDMKRLNAIEEQAHRQDEAIGANLQAMESYAAQVKVMDDWLRTFRTEWAAISNQVRQLTANHTPMGRVDAEFVKGHIDRLDKSIQAVIDRIREAEKDTVELDRRVTGQANPGKVLQALGSGGRVANIQVTFEK